MNDWTVRIEGASLAGEDAADALVSALVAMSPAVSYGHGQIGVTLTVQAAGPREALALALDAFTAVAQAVAVSHVEADRAA